MGDIDALKDQAAVHLEIIAERDAYIETLMDTVEALRAAYKAHKAPAVPEEVREMIKLLRERAIYDEHLQAADLLEQQAQEIERLKSDRP